jgi:DNA-binding transcriptional ArsR family regulator
VLEIPQYPGARELCLQGRGLRIIPSYFKRAERPVALFDPNLPPVLVVPIDAVASVVTAATTDSLAALLGRTRAAILEAADGATTSQIARRLAITLPMASKHLTVLRGAGLVMSTRAGNRLHHTHTQLGLAMLGGSRHVTDLSPQRNIVAAAATVGDPGLPR